MNYPKYFILDADGNYKEEIDEYGRSILFQTKGNPTDCVYSDRLLQWDHKKHDTLCQKHFGNEGQLWGSRSPEKIEAFLIDYLGKPLKLVKILEGVNVSNGYPYWCFFYQLTKV